MTVINQIQIQLLKKSNTKNHFSTAVIIMHPHLSHHYYHYHQHHQHLSTPDESQWNEDGNEYNSVVDSSEI